MAAVHRPQLSLIPGGLSAPQQARKVPAGRPGPSWQRWRLFEGALAGYCGAALATTVAVIAGGTRHPVVALGVAGFAMLALGLRMTLATAVASGVIGWLFYDGFVIGRHADLVLGGPLAGWSLLALVAAALCGSALGPHLSNKHRG
jgi:hypothetical protein